MVTGYPECCLSSGERRTLHSRTSANTNANPDRNTYANTHSDSYAMRGEMLTDAKAASHPGTASLAVKSDHSPQAKAAEPVTQR